MRPNKNHRVIKAVMKTYLDVLHFQRHGKGKIARDATGSEADARSEAYVIYLTTSPKKDCFYRLVYRSFLDAQNDVVYKSPKMLHMSL